jgi:hypothetical protein
VTFRFVFPLSGLGELIERQSDGAYSKPALADARESFPLRVRLFTEGSKDICQGRRSTS